MHRSRALAPTVLATCLLVPLASCGSGDAPPSTAGASSTAAAATVAPIQLTEADKTTCTTLSGTYPELKGKKLNVGTSPAPANYSATDPEDPANVIGIEPDLLTAAGECLGFTVSYSRLDFAGLIPALQSGNIDVVAAGMYASDERAAQVDFVQYMKAGEAALVQAGNPKKLASLADACGTIAAEAAGTVENEIIAAQSTECEAAGKEPIEPLLFQSTDRATSALGQKRADLFLTDAGVASYLAAKQPEVFSVGFSIPSDYIFGFGVAKTNAQLRDALSAALTQFDSSGLLAEQVSAWGFAEDQKITPSTKTS